MTSSSDKSDLSRLKISKKAYVAQSILTQWKSSAWFFPSIGLALVLFWLLFFSTRAPVQTEAPTPRAGVNSETTLARALPSNASVLNASGYVVAQRSAAVASKATGRLKELKVVEGDTIKSGEIIGILENDDVRALLQEKEAALVSLKAREDEAQAELIDAQHNLERMQTLTTTRTQAASKADLDSAQARQAKAQARVNVARADSQAGEAQVNKAKVDLSYTYILAPFDGTVLTKDADVGEIVAPFGSSTNARAAVVTLADMTSLQVEADVSEANIQKVFVGQNCEIVLDSYPDVIYQGEVVKIVPTVDRSKATVLTKIKFKELDARVIPEMSAKISFKLRTEG